MQELLGRLDFILQLFGSRAAIVDHQGHGQRLFGVPLEQTYGLLDSIVEDLEILFVQSADELAPIILNGGEQAYKPHIDADYRLLRVSRSQTYEQTGEQLRAIHLMDSSHSPSTHTS